MLELNNIYLGDCLKIMQSIDDHSIDLIFTDLPYGITAYREDKKINLNILWSIYKRIIKKIGTILLFATQPFTTDLIYSNKNDFQYCWYWIKNQGTNFFHAKRMPIRKIEEICVFKKGKYYPQMSYGHKPTNTAKGFSIGKVYHGKNIRNYSGGKTNRFPTNIIEFKCVNNYHRLHPNQKPIDLLKYFIKTYTDKNDIVLDSCSGSGSLGLACRDLNRNFILIEKEKKYFDMAKQNLNL